MRLPRRRRLLVVLAVQAVVLGVVATGALGTSKGTSTPSSPVAVVATDLAHDTTVKLKETPVVANDPNRLIPELEQQQNATVATTTHDPVAQTAVPAALVPSTAASFDGLVRSAMTTGYFPPDPVGDVGTTQYVQAVNGGLAVFSKTGDNLTGTINDTSFWAGLSGCEPTSTRGVVDPTLNYDQYADRWVYSELSIDQSVQPWNQSYMCVAVSTTGDATDTWNRYVFAAGNSPRGNTMPDYPKLGVWPDGYYLSFNDFDSSSPHNFVGAGAMVLERSAMLTGAAAQSVFFDLRGIPGIDNGGMLPSDADGGTPPPGGAPDYFVSPVDDPADVNDQMGIWAFHVDWAVPSNSTFTNPQAVQVGAFNSQGYSIPQPGGQPLSGIADGRLMNRVQYRNFGGYETLVTNLTVQNGSGGDAPRWFELRKAGGSWSVNQESTFAPTNLNRWMGSAAMDGAGDMALGYSAGDASTAAGLRYTGRLVSDPLQTMEAETVLVNGGGTQSSATGRWGDYSQLTVDPTDDCTFWYTGEYYAASSVNSWSTRIGSFRFPSCVTAVGPTYSVVPVVTGTWREGNTLSTTTGTWSPSPTGYTYQWRRCDSSAISCVDIPGATSSSYVLQAADAGRRLRVKVIATANTGTGSVVSSATPTILPNVPVNSVLPALSGTMQVAQTVSTDNGTWSTYPSVTNTYSYQWQRCAPGCSDIPDPTAINQNYTLQAADAGAKMRVGVTATTIGGQTGPVYSAQSAVVTLPPAPTNTVAPTISGTTQELQWLTAQVGSWTGVAPITYTYQWERCNSAGTGCAVITGATSQVYRLANGDIDSRFRVTVTATNPGGASSLHTAVTTRVLPLPPVIVTAPALSTGNPAVGSAVSTTDGSWSGATPITISYQWQTCTVSCIDIAGATSNRLDVTSAVAGGSLRAVVTATNSGGSTSASTSTSAVVPLPPASSGSAGSAASGGSSSSSGGGGTGGALDLAVSGYATPTTAVPGENVTYVIWADDLTPNQLAQQVYVTVTLPAGLSYVSSTADRGPGCTQTSSTQVKCYLDFLSGQATRGTVIMTLKVVAAGAQTLTATLIC